MGSFFSREELAKFRSAQSLRFKSPVPTRMISNGEFTPMRQSELQRRFEARLKDLADRLAKKQGLSRRQFLRTAAGMSAAFLAMNEVFGRSFVVSSAEAADPQRAAERARRLARQFVFDDQVHFLREGSKHTGFVGLRGYTAGHLNLQAPDPGGMDKLMFENFVKEVFMDSDTKIALLSSAPSDDAQNWFLTNEESAAARGAANKQAGSRRLLCHSVFTPGQPGWLEQMDRAIAELKPDSWKGYTTGDPQAPSKFPWRMDDEKLVYPAYEKMMKAGIRVVCVHKGLMPHDAEQKTPELLKHADVSDIGKAAKDWPKLYFVVYHSGFRPLPHPTPEHSKRFEETGRIDWVSDLAEIPEKFGVNNVGADLGAVFALTAVTNPRISAGIVGQLVKGLGVQNVYWGTDSIWFGSPQWQIEAFRRLEIPRDLQKKFGWAALGDATGSVKTAILGGNAARLYKVRQQAAAGELDWTNDGFAALKAEYERSGGVRSNRAYGYVA